MSSSVSASQLSRGSRASWNFPQWSKASCSWAILWATCVLTKHARPSLEWLPLLDRASFSSFHPHAPLVKQESIFLLLTGRRRPIKWVLSCFSPPFSFLLGSPLPKVSTGGSLGQDVPFFSVLLQRDPRTAPRSLLGGQGRHIC